MLSILEKNKENVYRDCRYKIVFLFKSEKQDQGNQKLRNNTAYLQYIGPKSDLMIFIGKSRRLCAMHDFNNFHPKSNILIKNNYKIYLGRLFLHFAVFLQYFCRRYTASETVYSTSVLHLLRSLQEVFLILCQ